MTWFRWIRRPTVDVPSAAFLHGQLHDMSRELMGLRAELARWRFRALRAEKQLMDVHAQRQAAHGLLRDAAQSKQEPKP